MTSLTYANLLELFFDVIYGWAGFWLTIMVFLMLSRKGKNAADYEVIGFRASIAFVCLAVTSYRWFSFPSVILVPPLSIFGWTSMMSTIRVAQTIWNERKREKQIGRSFDHPISEDSYTPPVNVGEGV